MSALGPVGIRSDPLMAYNFVVSLLDTSSTLATINSAAVSALTDVALGGFSECTGLDTTLETEEYREGGRNGTTLRFPTRVTWAPIVLKRGMGAGTALWDWHHGFVRGEGKRRDGVITLLDDLHLPSHIWYFRRGLPSRYTGPALNAGQSNVAIEAIEIVHEGIYQVPGVGFGAAAASAAVSAVVGG
jgi:phage tail-like protein